MSAFLYGEAGPDGGMRLFTSESGGGELHCAACKRPAGAREFLHGGGQPALHTGCVTTWHWHGSGCWSTDWAAVASYPADVTCSSCRSLPGFRSAVRRERWRKRRAVTRRVLAYPYRRLWPARERLSRRLYPYGRDDGS